MNPELTQIIDRLGRMEEKQDTILTQLSGVTEGARYRDAKIKDLEQTVYGNGEDGLKTEVTTIRTICKQNHATKGGSLILRGVAQTVLAAIILAVASAMVSLWKAHN